MATTLTDHQAALKHKYRVVSGGPYVPGVTTILAIKEKGGLKWGASGIAAQTTFENKGRVKSIAKKHRVWLLESGGDRASRNKKRALAQEGSDVDVFLHWCRGEFDRQWRAKANRGSRVHEVAELWSKHPGEEVDVRVGDSIYVDALQRFYDEYHPVFKYIECIVLNVEENYGGRFDGIVWLDGPRTPAGLYLIDYKTGGEWAYEVAVQAEGYLHGKLATWKPDGSLGRLKALPKLKGARTIYLRDDGSVAVVDPFEHISRDQAWRAFLASKALYEVHREIETYLKEIEE